MPLYPNIRGARKEIIDIYPNINGSRKQVSRMYANIGGVQKTIFEKVYNYIMYNYDRGAPSTDKFYVYQVNTTGTDTEYFYNMFENNRHTYVGNSWSFSNNNKMTLSDTEVIYMNNGSYLSYNGYNYSSGMRVEGLEDKYILLNGRDQYTLGDIQTGWAALRIESLYFQEIYYKAIIYYDTLWEWTLSSITDITTTDPNKYGNGTSISNRTIVGVPGDGIIYMPYGDYSSPTSTFIIPVSSAE